MQTSLKKQPLGLSQKSFSNEREMNKHIWRLYEGPYNHQAQYCECCTDGGRKHNWPETKYKRKYIRHLVKRPADTASSRAKDLFGKGAFYNNPTRPHSARTLMSSKSQKIMRRKKCESEKRLLTTTDNRSPIDLPATSELTKPSPAEPPLTQRFYVEPTLKVSTNSEIKPQSLLP